MLVSPQPRSAPPPLEIKLQRGTITFTKLYTLSQFSIDQQLKHLRQSMRFTISLKRVITPNTRPHLEKISQACFLHYFIIRMHVLLSDTDNFQELNNTAVACLKEEYLSICQARQMSKDSDYQFLVVVVGSLVLNRVRRIFPELEITERLKLDVFHLLIHETLGIFVGDASIKLILSKYTAPNDMKTTKNAGPSMEGSHSSNSSNNSNNKPQTNEANSPLLPPHPPKELNFSLINNRQHGQKSDVQRFDSELKAILKTSPPPVLPPVVKKKLDNLDQDQINLPKLANNRAKSYQCSSFQRVKKIRLESNQLSTSFVEVKEQEPRLPYVRTSKIILSPECASMYYCVQRKPEKAQPKAVEPARHPKGQPVNKRNIQFWQDYVEKLRQQSVNKPVDSIQHMVSPDDLMYVSPKKRPQISSEDEDEEELSTQKNMVTSKSAIIYPALGPRASRNQPLILFDTGEQTPGIASAPEKAIKSKAPSLGSVPLVYEITFNKSKKLKQKTICLPTISEVPPINASALDPKQSRRDNTDTKSNVHTPRDRHYNPLADDRQDNKENQLKGDEGRHRDGNKSRLGKNSISVGIVSVNHKQKLYRLKAGKSQFEQSCISSKKDAFYQT